MPTSDAEGKDIALGWYQQIQPSTVVDVGVGDGTYARLMRQTPDLIKDAVTAKVVSRAWSDRWTGVEAWEPYVEQFALPTLYDEIVLSDVRRLPWTAFRADLVIAGDVLEHMTRDDAVAVLRRITKGAANVIVSIPVLHLPQGAVNGNPYEAHVHHWSAAEMANVLTGAIRAQWVGNVLAYFWWSREVDGG